MFEATLAILSDPEQDTFRAVEFLSGQPDDPLAVADTFNQVALHLYWEVKRLPQVISLARAGIQYALAQAAAEFDPEQAAELKRKARVMAYNLASCTWPGWGEPDIPLTLADMAVGLDAARACLRLATELGEGDLRLARANWMIGAHLLATRDMESARAAFELAAIYAEAAEASADLLLARAFTALIDVLAGDDPASLEAIEAELAAVEDGPDFVQQVETARRVFTA
jgi:hypothetical protein